MPAPPGTRFSASTAGRYWHQWAASRSDLPDTGLYLVLAAALGTTNIVLNPVMGGLYPPLDWFAMVTAPSFPVPITSALGDRR